MIYQTIRALDKPAYPVKCKNTWQDTHLFKFLCVSRTKIKISITQLMFFQSVVSEMLFTHLGKGRGNPNWFPFGHVRFITETDIANLRNRILNIDQLEMKHILFSGGSVV